MASYTPSAMHDVLWSKTDWVIGDLGNGNKYIGSNGVVTATAADAPWFDVRPYRQVQLWVVIGALTGGSTPSVEWNLEHGMSSDATLTFLGSTNLTIAAAGNVICLVAGDCGAGYNASPGGASYSKASAASPFCPPYVRIRFNPAGSATGLTAPMRTYLYGLTR